MQIDSFVSAERLSWDIADSALWDYSKHGKVYALHEILPYAESVTYDDIKRFAKENFVEERVFVEVLLP